MAADKDFVRLYLYKNDPEGCCKYWFGDFAVEGCVNSLIQGAYSGVDDNDDALNMTAVNKTEEYLQMWYPAINKQKCLRDGEVPSWMLVEGYPEWYLFNRREQCCAAFGFC